MRLRPGDVVRDDDGLINTANRRNKLNAQNRGDDIRCWLAGETAAGYAGKKKGMRFVLRPDAQFTRKMAGEFRYSSLCPTTNRN